MRGSPVPSSIIDQALDAFGIVQDRRRTWSEGIQPVGLRQRPLCPAIQVRTLNRRISTPALLARLIDEPTEGLSFAP
jgi:hypothetical protein